MTKKAKTTIKKNIVKKFGPKKVSEIKPIEDKRIDTYWKVPGSY